MICRRADTDVPTLGISDYDQPHRVVVAATTACMDAVEAPTYRYSTSARPELPSRTRRLVILMALPAIISMRMARISTIRSVPRHATEPAEIMFAGTPDEAHAQQRALDRFIDGTACLATTRGNSGAQQLSRAVDIIG